MESDRGYLLLKKNILKFAKKALLFFRQVIVL